MNRKAHLIYATKNDGKTVEIGRMFGLFSLRVEPVANFLKVKPSYVERGTTSAQNAFLKTIAFGTEIVLNDKLRGHRFVIVGDDTGVSIEGLGGEPGIFVRRWKDRAEKREPPQDMGDEELISYTLERCANLTGKDREAVFRTALSVIVVDEEGDTASFKFEGSLKGRILEKADPIRVKGFPFESLFWVSEYEMLLGALHGLPDAEKRRGKLNHRERAIREALNMIRNVLESHPEQ